MYTKLNPETCVNKLNVNFKGIIPEGCTKNCLLSLIYFLVSYVDIEYVCMRWSVLELTIKIRRIWNIFLFLTLVAHCKMFIFTSLFWMLMHQKLLTSKYMGLKCQNCWQYVSSVCSELCLLSVYNESCILVTSSAASTHMLHLVYLVLTYNTVGVNTTECGRNLLQND